MTLVGQGGRILLVTAPALLAAVLAHLRAPGLVRLPIPGAVLTPIGVALMASGLVLWGAAVAQLLVGFPKGRLVTSGAYGVVRNPIYASVGLLVLPGLALVTATWGYLVPAATLCVAVEAFIGAEERDLLRVFGDEYRRYTERVPRLLPFARATAAG
jgi:protein-S-isoprenylcysteine O-methyltransferase Ste14